MLNFSLRIPIHLAKFSTFVLILILEGGNLLAVLSKSKSMLDCDASQSPLSLTKLDPLKADFDLNQRL